MNLRAVCTVALVLFVAQTASTRVRAEETILVGMCREAHVAEPEVANCAAKADDCLEEAMRTAHREDPSRNPDENGDYQVLTQGTLLACVAKAGGRIVTLHTARLRSRRNRPCRRPRLRRPNGPPRRPCLLRVVAIACGPFIPGEDANARNRNGARLR